MCHLFHCDISSIQKGKMKITAISEQGKEAVVSILGTNDFFGEGCLAGQVQGIATAVTIMDSVIVKAGKSRHSPRDPSGTSVLRDINRPSCGPGIRVEVDLVDQLFNSSDNRASFATTATSKSTVHC